MENVKNNDSLISRLLILLKAGKDELKNNKKLDFRSETFKNIESTKITSKALDELSLRVVSEFDIFTEVMFRFPQNMCNLNNNS